MINIPKGTKDVLPQDSYKWHYIEDTAKKIAKLYNLKEIRTPVFEHTELFLRGVGDTTDIVNKEMYTFLDKGNRSITLKPEGTAGVCRSFIENGLANSALPCKTFYISPVYRYERPQAGRLREHHQFGCEIFGSYSADMDAEVIFIADSYLKALKLCEVELNINSIGCKECRPKFNEALKVYLRPHLDEMCETCKSRFDKNPLRIIDCKEENCKKIVKDAPKILDYLCEDCKAHFEKLKEYLDMANIKYKINPNIVRGLDYYSKTVFEFVSTSIGSQGTVLAGGRYDTLVENLDGPKIPAVGFGSGIERVILLMENTNVEIPQEEKLTVYIAGMDERTKNKAFELAGILRKNGFGCDVDHMNRSLKAQFKYADKIDAKFVAVIGESELDGGFMTVKDMKNSTQENVEFEKIVGYFKEK